MRRKRNQFTLAWYTEDFPLVSQAFLKHVKRKSTRQQGVFRGLILGLAEEGLRQKSPIKTPLDRIEEKLDMLLKEVRQGVPISAAMQTVEESQDIEPEESGLSAEEKARLNRILSL